MDLKEANKIIGNTYKQIRKSKKFTQEEVAEKSDLTPEYLSKFENGKYNASIYNIILLCKAIDTNPTQLFNDDNSAAIITTITDELKDMDVSDQKLILSLIKRIKNKANI
ncbi:MAG: helix-turn-helix transcriptional regulator [Clostridia bacterium]|nr:helix-turn-helix transcriptional regulator [Clostridia bacterium]